MELVSKEELKKYKDVLVEYSRKWIKFLPEGWSLPFAVFEGDFFLPALGGNSGLDPKEIQKRLLYLLTKNRDYSKKGVELYINQKAKPQEIILFNKIGKSPLEPDWAMYIDLRNMPEFKDFKEIEVARSLDPEPRYGGWRSYSACDMNGVRY